MYLSQCPNLEHSKSLFLLKRAVWEANFGRKCEIQVEHTFCWWDLVMNHCCVIKWINWAIRRNTVRMDRNNQFLDKQLKNSPQTFRGLVLYWIGQHHLKQRLGCRSRKNEQTKNGWSGWESESINNLASTSHDEHPSTWSWLDMLRGNVLLCIGVQSWFWIVRSQINFYWRAGKPAVFTVCLSSFCSTCLRRSNLVGSLRLTVLFFFLS